MGSVAVLSAGGGTGVARAASVGRLSRPAGALDATRGSHRYRVQKEASTHVLAGARCDAGVWAERAILGSLQRWFAHDNVRATIEFPHTPERPRDVGVAILARVGK
jgi:hypothetical protein